VDFERKRQGLPFMTPSRLFIYYNERAIEGTTASDAGASIRDGFKTIAAQGVCQEKHWPYNPAMFATEPNKDCYFAALSHKTLQYLGVAQFHDMLDCLASGFPFVFGITVYDSFESDASNATGNVPMPGPNEGVLGGHALLAVGYSLATARINFRNSWGTSWGDAGYGTIPIQYLTNPDLASDFWTIRLEE
jgi:C1A family cysteine protease